MGHPPDPVTPLRGFHSRHQRLVGIGVATLITVVVVIALWGRRHDLVTAIESAPLWLLACAVGLQLIATTRAVTRPLEVTGLIDLFTIADSAGN